MNDSLDAIQGLALPVMVCAAAVGIGMVIFRVIMALPLIVSYIGSIAALICGYFMAPVYVWGVPVRWTYLVVMTPVALFLVATGVLRQLRDGSLLPSASVTESEPQLPSPQGPGAPLGHSGRGAAAVQDAPRGSGKTRRPEDSE